MTVYKTWLVQAVGFAGCALGALPILPVAAEPQIFIDLRGSVSPRCILDTPRTIDLGSLNEAGHASAHILAGCNIAMTVTLTAEHGFLNALTPLRMLTGFSASLPYVLTLSGAGASISCDKQQLTTRSICMASVPAQTSPETFAVEVSWPAPLFPLTAGTYADRVTIEVGPAW